MRLIPFLAILALVSIWADAQTLPFRTQGDFYVADFTKDAVFRFQDVNGDGDVQDAGEQFLFYDATSVGPDLGTPTAITVHPLDGSVWIADTSVDLILRLEDKNGDGDANDPNEFTVFYDNTGAFLMGSPTGLCFDPLGILYVAVAGTSVAPNDFVMRLQDLNSDGDALDVGEATIFLDNTALSGQWLSVPADMKYFKGKFYIVDNTTLGGVIIAIQDLNNDGDAQDANEVTQWAISKPGGSNTWKTIFELKGGALFGVELGGSYSIYRWQDLNSDGDAMDAGELTTFFDSTNNAGNHTMKTTFAITTDPAGNLYACNRTTDVIYKLTDLNADLDANDAGEVTAYHDSTTTPLPPVVLDGARDCVIAPAGVVGPGAVAPAIGKTADFLLDDPLGGALPYVAAVSFGQAGIPLGGTDIRQIPLTFDVLTFISVSNLVPLFQDFQGLFPNAGQAVARMAIPNESALVNVTLYMAFVTLKPTSPTGILTVSRPYDFVIGR